MATSSQFLNVFSQYLKRREPDLLKFHPQWDFTNRQIIEGKDLSKRDLTPICIPPSWDLIQKYAGALDENADGFNRELYERGKAQYEGDQGESEFLDVVRNFPIGGILIGNISSAHLSYGKELSDEQKEYYMLPSTITNGLDHVGDFEIDFLFIHETGIQHFEVKRNQVIEKSAVDRIVTKAKRQIAKQRSVLKQLFDIVCRCQFYDQALADWDGAFCNQSVIYLCGENATPYPVEGNENCVVVSGIENLKSFLSMKYQKINDHDQVGNIFKNKLIRNFIIFLACYRPDFFVSPVQCALKVYRNIFSHQVNKVNFYVKKHSIKTQNTALTVSDFLTSLKHVKDTNINFGEYKDLYLTKEQMEAIGNFNESGNFEPKKQLIFGPPGSGKSLIAMIKIFILAQMEDRQDRKLIYATANYWARSEVVHAEKLKTFVQDNKGAFCRAVKFCKSDEKQKLFEQNTSEDFVFDEMQNLDYALKNFDQHQIVTLIETGKWGERRSVAKAYETNNCESSSRHFAETELRSIFRSTKQIQKYTAQIEHDSSDFISGHNFDGVKVESYRFDNQAQLQNAVEERLTRLIEVEKCEQAEIGVYFQRRNYQEFFFDSKYSNVNCFNHYAQVKSTEFPVMILVKPPPEAFYLLATRAICHLIVFRT